MTLWHWIALSLALLFGIDVGLNTLQGGNGVKAIAAGSITFASALTILLAQPIGCDKEDQL